jgi:DNA-3-methyladenine glycosylase II
VDDLCAAHPAFAPLLASYGYPPFWERPNHFHTLVKIILEQQVHLHSAAATWRLLAGHFGSDLRPEQLVDAPVELLKRLQVSRQKAAYLKSLSEHVLSGQLMLAELASLPDQAVADRLTAVKGIGRWTVNIYLLMVLHRLDIFPVGDVALYQSMREHLPGCAGLDKTALDTVSATWAPRRSMATCLLYHAYLQKRGRFFATE